MSVIIVAHCDSANLRLVVERLRLQTAASVLEFVLVTPDDAVASAIGAAGHGLAGVRVVILQAIEDAGSAKAAGIKAAVAPLVAFLEDHSLPANTWAESLIKAHAEGDYAAVGPVVQNANPGTSASWGCFLVYYGQYMFARPQAELRHLPANHTCYRRSVLLEYGPRLSDMMEAEFVLHGDLLDRGLQIRQEPKARAYHINHPRLAPTLVEYWFASRVFAAERAARWKRLRKLTYFFGSPLIPFVRSLRIVRDAVRGGAGWPVLARSLPAVFVILAVGTAGEMAAYALGGGDARARLKSFESRRHAYITRQDLESAARI